MSIELKELVAKCRDLKALYIEDDENARNAMLRILKRIFGKVTVAFDGLDGLEAYQNDSFDVVISDINMPNMNGIELLKRVREYSKDVAFFLISAHNESTYFTDAISLGVDYFIIKPLEDEQLFKALDIAVKKIEHIKLTHQYQQQLEIELKKRTQELEDKLYKDDLTLLGSRYAFFEQIRNSKECTLYLMDIEKFHVINDLFGHDVGNRLLSDFGSLVEESSKSIGAKVYRLSSDEFAILKEEENYDVKVCKEFLERLFETVKNAEFVYNNEKIKLHIRVGVAYGNESLFQNASIALDYAKAHIKDYMFYSLENDTAKENFEILQERHFIQRLIDNDGAVAVYQGIVDKNKSICKYETLMRLRDDENKTLLSPAHFLSTAINSGLYDILSTQVIKQGLDLLNRSDKIFSFNFTYSDITNTPFLEEIENFFKKYPNNGKRAVFEITENENIENYDVVKRFINRFRKYDVKIAIDDFGTGFSNFNYIFEIEPDYLKIDGSLIKDIESNKKSMIMTEAIINFSKKLGIKVIAEFVRNEEIFLKLKELGVDEFQGFYFAEPVIEEKL